MADYAAHDGWKGLKAARAQSPQQVVDAVKASGLRGRGGAGFPTGIKWQTVLDAPGTPKYIVCNADEGDSGTFADRMQIGKASCRERWCPYGYISVGGVSLKKTNKTQH